VDLPQARDLEQTFYNWKNKYGSMDVNDAHRLKSLEEENAG
jgi:putative transposase